MAEQKEKTKEEKLIFKLKQLDRKLHDSFSDYTFSFVNACNDWVLTIRSRTENWIILNLSVKYIEDVSFCNDTLQIIEKNGDKWQFGFIV